VAIRQQTQGMEVLAQSLALPYEVKNKYRLAGVPADKNLKSHPHDGNGWEPTGDELQQLPELFTAREQSSFCHRVLMTCLGARQIRALSMHYAGPGQPDRYIQDKPCRCGGWICCPTTSTIFEKGTSADPEAKVMIGRVQEDFIFGKNCCLRYLQCCCKCTYYNNIETVNPETKSLEEKYKLVVNLCCCGRTNNCCGGTCCKNDAVFDIVDKDGKVAAHLQKTYAPTTGAGACCRMCCQFSNYMVSFPEGASEEERVLIVASVLQAEYMFFEGDDN